MRKTVRGVVIALVVLLLPILGGLGLVALTRHQWLQIGHTWYQAALLPANQWGISYGQVPHCQSVTRVGCVVITGWPNRSGICI